MIAINLECFQERLVDRDRRVGDSGSVQMLTGEMMSHVSLTSSLKAKTESTSVTINENVNAV